MAASLTLDAIIAATSLTLRAASVFFVRFHPLGPRYLSRIYWNASLYAAACLAQWVYLHSDDENRKSRCRRKFAWHAPLLGWLDTARPISTALGFAVNALSLLAAIDFVYRDYYFHQSSLVSFSRVGFVDATSARIVVRSPLEGSVELQLYLDQQDESPIRKTVLQILPENDWVGTFLLEGLTAGSNYTYTTNTSHAGSFQTITSDGEQQSPSPWSLVSTSCIKPFYPYNPLDHGLRIRGLEHLDNYLTAHPVDLMLFLGDFIYIDLPLPLGWDQDAYTTAYRQVYASPSWTQQLRDLPWIHVYDDHEIINDWAGNETGLYKTAMKPFWDYHGHANPPSQFGAGKTYYVVRREGVSFFVLDTRRYRANEDLEDGPSKTMLGPEQLDDLKDWLRTETDWKVIVSGVPFTRNWRGPDSADSWSGYLWERDAILELMKKTGGGIILSGDRHEHATTLFPASDNGTKPVIEFSTSPLNQFYEPISRFHREIEPTDVSVFSWPWGTSKFGVVTFDASVAGQLSTHYDLVVDGKKIWEYGWEQTK